MLKIELEILLFLRNVVQELFEKEEVSGDYGFYFSSSRTGLELA